MLKQVLPLCLFSIAALAAPLSASAETPAPTAAEHASHHEQLTEGEIKKIDADQKKITIKHGEIKNLEMPPMTMVFRVKDAAFLDQVKPGDKVRFKVEKLLDGYTIMAIQPAS
ncbi:hypothetical protein GCM10007907_16430 [Chitinimonas prasina]|uniref:Copper-binding protein n=1 Tax=Chitinimonas prasina TaxID=1434937 RepID=A0ABQ5YEE6_9NEIS|nr:copper-binding protein [Chitinimonas prasina]GLR12853.1 hypothetical protein GCM10007907_16430 [Chitinimonas prasina]